MIARLIPCTNAQASIKRSNRSDHFCSADRQNPPVAQPPIKGALHRHGLSCVDTVCRWRVIAIPLRVDPVRRRKPLTGTSLGPKPGLLLQGHLGRSLGMCEGRVEV